MSAPDYKVVGITRRSRVVHVVKRRGAPSPRWLCDWGMKRDCLFVVWYMPTVKGWKILDIRTARETRAPGGRRWWTKYRRSTSTFASEDAAVMRALHAVRGSGN